MLKWFVLHTIAGYYEQITVFRVPASTNYQTHKFSLLLCKLRTHPTQIKRLTLLDLSGHNYIVNGDLTGNVTSCNSTYMFDQEAWL